jgi:outer membrane protein OmpA-like peptidoglycan-associated protein
MRKQLRFFILILCCTCGIYTHAQTENKAAKKLYDQAVAILDTSRNQNDQAIQLLNAAIAKDPQFTMALQVLFQLHLELKHYTPAIEVFEKAYAGDSISFDPYIVKYATALTSIGDYAKAQNVLHQLLSRTVVPSYLLNSANGLKKVCDFALAQKQDPAVVVTNVGDSVNTSAAEYFPTVTIQDSLFLFMRRNDWKREDFYYSIITPNGFTKAQPLSDTLNFADKKGSPSLSSDLQTLYFAADYAEQGYGRYDIYKVNKTKTGWSFPKNVGRNINSDFWESAPSISPDGQALYFCSNIPGGYGGIDIYVSYKNEKGGWDEAINLGPNINTAGDEQTPFIHADNKTLYFASSGWPGFGGSDLFVARKKIDGTWSKPINLGYPINTFDNEGSIAVAGDGYEGYIASDRGDSRGGLDIYKVVLAPNTRANKTYYFNGFITDANTKKPLPGIVKLVDPLEDDNYMQVNVDSTGYFVLALPYFDSLGVQVNSPNHEYASMLLAADSISKLAGTRYQFNLAAIQKKYSKNFNNVFFDVNTAKLKKVSTVELDALVTYLQQTPGAKICIEGHTDNTGNAKWNMELSSQRAIAIAQYLSAQGVEQIRITTKGYGATQPIADNATEVGRAKNRRTSFTITLP